MMQSGLVKKTSHLENKLTFPNVCLYLARSTKWVQGGGAWQKEYELRVKGLS